MSPVVVIFPDRIAYELFYGVKVEWQDFGLTQDTTTQRQLELSRSKEWLKIKKDYRTEKVGVAHLTVN